MIRASGHVIRHTGRLLHFTMAMAMGLLVAASLVLAGLAFRLSLGPINANWVSAVHGDVFIINGTVGLSFDQIELAWEGFHGGVGAPLDLRLSNVVLTDPQGHRLLDARRALLTLSLRGMLTGHLVPRRLELDDGLVTVTRDRTGSFNLGTAVANAADAGDRQTGSAAEVRSVLRDFIHPAAIDSGPGEPGQLVRVRLRNFGLLVRDEQLGSTWQASGSELDLERRSTGAVTGSARVPFASGDQSAEITLSVNLPRAADGRIEATLSTVRPAMFGEFARSVPLLAALDAPFSVNAVVQVDTSLTPTTGRADIAFAAGRFNLAAGHVPIRDGTVALTATSDRLSIDSAHFVLPSAKAGSSADLSFHGSVQREAERLTASVAGAIDRLEIADLAKVWPEGAGVGARSWVVQNVTAGTVSHATAAFVAESATDLHDIVLTKANADLDADNVSITWLDQIPPIDRAHIHLRAVDPDKLVISAPSGRQSIGKNGELLLQDVQMEITGLSMPDQDAKLHLYTEGSVANTVALLKEPRLHLFKKQSIDLKDASGSVSAAISLQFPLENSLRADQIEFQTSAHLGNARIGKLVAGQDLSDGEFDLTADKDGLHLRGQGSLAAIPVTLDGSMDFNSGPPSQVFQRITVNGRPDAAQLATAGIDLKDVVSSGEIPLAAVLSERRNGEGSIALNADLAAVALSFQPLAWTKPAGTPSTASATLLLSHDRLTAISNIAVGSNTLSLNGSAICADGAVRVVSIDRARFGRTDMRGTVRLPADGPISVALSGPEIDLSTRLAGDYSTSEGAASEPQNWSLDARFEHALLANGETAKALAVQAKTVDGVTRMLDLTGQLLPGYAFSVRINGASGERRLTVDAADAGAFLRGSGLTTAVRSGRLSVTGAYGDTPAAHPLDGIVRIDNSRIVGAPVMGKVLQAMTLYGVADLLGGPGIGATRIVVPFRYEQKHLRITDGRLFSASLGLTAEGLIDLSTNRVSMNGTIVPAYFFNSLLGHIPFVGKLFSPETGGGLFAARFSIDGPFSDPAVSVNPLSVLTPGFLRGLFDIGAKSR